MRLRRGEHPLVPHPVCSRARHERAESLGALEVSQSDVCRTVVVPPPEPESDVGVMLPRPQHAQTPALSPVTQRLNLVEIALYIHPQHIVGQTEEHVL
jgi:hypothetical protein